MKIRKAVLVISCQVPGFLIDMACQANTETRGLHQVYTCSKFRFINRPSGRDDADGITLPESRRFYNGFLIDNGKPPLFLILFEFALDFHNKIKILSIKLKINRYFSHALRYIQIRKHSRAVEAINQKTSFINSVECINL
jgi:hypothetical protein